MLISDGLVTAGPDTSTMPNNENAGLQAKQHTGGRGGRKTKGEEEERRGEQWKKRDWRAEKEELRKQENLW